MRNKTTHSVFQVAIYFFAGWFLFVASPWAIGADFRVESKVFKGNDEQPDSSGLTLFVGDTVYDFANESRAITILSPKQERVILLDPAHEQKTEISTKQVLQFCENMLKRRESVNDKKLQFMLQPEFKIQTGKQPSELTFQSEFVTYQIESFSPSDKSVAQKYRAFSDWSSKINALANHGWPPFARVSVNKSLADENLVPTKVTLLITPQAKTAAASNNSTTKNVANQSNRTIHLRSQHQLQTELTTEDQNKIASATALLQKLKPVGLVEFQQKQAR